MGIIIEHSTLPSWPGKLVFHSHFHPNYTHIHTHACDRQVSEEISLLEGAEVVDFFPGFPVC